VAFSLSNTGIGHCAGEAADHLRSVPAGPDGTTSRQFGGTALGLSISTELTRLLGVTSKVQSSPARAARLRFTFPLCKMRKATTAILRKRLALTEGVSTRPERGVRAGAGWTAPRPNRGCGGDDLATSAPVTGSFWSSKTT